MRVSKLILAMTKFGLGTAIALGFTTANLKPQSVAAAEKITFYLSIFGEFALSVEDLATFARSGEITPEFAYYANRLDEQTLKQLRQILQTNIDVEPITIYRLTNMPMGEDFLRRLGNIIYTHPQRNGLYAIRAALIQASEAPEGLTAINFLRHFPTAEMQLNTDAIFSIIEEAENFFAYKDATITAIAGQAEKEATQSNLDLAQLPDLRSPG
ncbi:MAG: alpha/beta hydrolase, partial [Cyanobacteria bacterium P01_A01_bin.83]